MERTLRLRTGREVALPCRMIRASEMVDMGIDYVENKIYFNKTTLNEDFDDVESNIMDNMAILDYVDCSKLSFSSSRLKKAVEKQLARRNDFIILPAFKDETQYDINEKFKLAKVLRETYNKEMIIEFSYKPDLNITEFQKNQDSFDFLAIHYGIHFGRFPSFTKIAEKVLMLKNAIGKPICCMAVPLMFSGSQQDHSSYLLPIWDLVADLWVKNWKQGGGDANGELKIIDFRDLKNKSELQWYQTGHPVNEVVTSVDITVFDLFNNPSDEVRDIYKRILTDEVIAELNQVTPATVEALMSNPKYPLMYMPLVVGLYREKLILQEVREAEWLRPYELADRKNIEKEIRGIFSPQKIEQIVDTLIEMAGRGAVPLARVMQEINVFKTNNP